MPWWRKRVCSPSANSSVHSSIQHLLRACHVPELTAHASILSLVFWGCGGGVGGVKRHKKINRFIVYSNIVMKKIK